MKKLFLSPIFANWSVCRLVAVHSVVAMFSTFLVVSGASALVWRVDATVVGENATAMGSFDYDPNTGSFGTYSSIDIQVRSDLGDFNFTDGDFFWVMKQTFNYKELLVSTTSI